MNLDLNRVAELESLSEEYTSILHKVYLFIENYELDENEIWDYLNQRYDEDLTYKPEE